MDVEADEEIGPFAGEHLTSIVWRKEDSVAHRRQYSSIRMTINILMNYIF